MKVCDEESRTAVTGLSMAVPYFRFPAAFSIGRFPRLSPCVDSHWVPLLMAWVGAVATPRAKDPGCHGGNQSSGAGHCSRAVLDLR